MAGRASIVGAAATHVGKVREHNEDAHYIDADLGLFLVCDGMGGHAAGEVASEIAIRAICGAWDSQPLRDAAAQWLERGTAEAKMQLLDVVRGGVLAAHDAILAEAGRDDSKSGMGTTLVGAMVVGGELVFAHAGDSRAYLVRDGISMQLTEDHTLLARLLAAGIDVDVSGEGSRFRSMLTNALGIGDECKVSTFVVPLADGDRFLLCSDGISEYVPENEVGDVLTKQSSPTRAAQRLIDLALERGGGDNATAVVVRVLEAGETPLPAEQRKKDDAAIGACALWGTRLTPQQRLRALRIAIPRDHNFGEKLPPHALGDRVAWIIVEGSLVQDGAQLGPGALVYPESLVHLGEAVPLPDRDALAITRSDVRALAIRADDFRELCDDDGELGEALLENLAALIAGRKVRTSQPRARDVDPRGVDARGNTDPQLRPVRVPIADADAFRPTDPDMSAAAAAVARERAETIPDDPDPLRSRPRLPSESAIIAPVSPRATPPQAPVRPSPPPPRLAKAAPHAPAPTRPSPLPPRLSARTPSPDAAGPEPSRPTPDRAMPAVEPAGSASPTPNRAMPAVAAGASQAPTRPSPARLATPASTRKSDPHVEAKWRGDTLVDVTRRSEPQIELPRRGDTQVDVTRRSDPHLDATPPELRTPSRPTPAVPAATPVGPPPPPPSSLTPRPPVLPRATPASGVDAARGRAADGARRSRPSTPPPPPPPRGVVPTEPETETYLEIEADLPPESGVDADFESELALSIALSGDIGAIESVRESVSVTIDDDNMRVTETVTETDALTLTVTVAEPITDRDAIRKRAITAQDSSSVSGTISIPDEDGAPPARRAKRHSEGWDE